MITLDRYPVSELRTCQAHTAHDADKLARCMHWRDDAGAWHCETLAPYRVEAPQDVEAAPPSQLPAPSTVEQRDTAHAVGGGSPNGDIYQRAIDAFGCESQIQIAIEEMAELTAALYHHERGRCHGLAVAREIADVLIVVEQLRLLFGAEMVDRTVCEKLARLGERIREASK